MSFISVQIHIEGDKILSLDVRLMAVGQFFLCLELNTECSDQGIVKRDDKIEEDRGK